MNEAIETALANLTRLTGDAVTWTWDIVVTGVRTEGIVLLLLAAIGAVSVTYGLSTLIGAIPVIARYRRVALGLVATTAGTSVVYLREPLLMTIAPEYWIVREGTSIATSNEIAIQTSTVEIPGPWIAVGLLFVLCVSFLIWGGASRREPDA